MEYCALHPIPVAGSPQGAAATKDLSVRQLTDLSQDGFSDFMGS
jgi:hypothetical protein